MNDYWEFTKIEDFRVIDADTLEIEIDLGFGIIKIEKFRLNRINAWETRGKDKDKGIKAKQWMDNVVHEAWVESKLKIRSYKQGKYGRYLIDAWVNDDYLNQRLLDDGLAILY